MFMVKDEFVNIKNLLKARIKTGEVYYKWFWIIYAVIILTSAAGIIFSILENINAVHHYFATDYSVTIIIGMVIGFIINIFTYRKTNLKLSVYPQTNTGRLISYMIFEYITVTVLVVALLIHYLINYGIVLIMSNFNDTIHLGLNIDFGFLVIGFFTYLMYCFLIVSFLDLIAVILRKWTYYAMMALTAITSLIILNLQVFVENLPKYLSFLIGEPSVIMFFLKALGLWLVIIGITLIINKYTIYHKSQNQLLKKRVVIICIVIAVVVIIGIPMIMMLSNSESHGSSGNEFVWDGEYTEPTSVDLSFDISHLPENGKINIVGTNFITHTPESWQMWSNTHAYIYGAELLDDLTSDILNITYVMPWYKVNSIDIYEFANPRIDIRLEGDTLHIDYEYDKTDVMILPVWSMIRQFDIFKDKNVLSDHVFLFSSGGSNTATVFIWVE